VINTTTDLRERRWQICAADRDIAINITITIFGHYPITHYLKRRRFAERD
jgi:hypothetical protein